MKKIILLSFFLLASAVTMTVSADKKKDQKKQAQQPRVVIVQLNTPSDSLSYAAGMAATQGLLPYLKEQLHIDEAQLPEFIRGYEDAIAKASDPAFKAYVAGSSIAQQATERILPGMNRNLKDTPDSLKASLFHKGFIAAVGQDSTFFSMPKARKYFQTRSQAIINAANEAWKAKNEQWMADNKTKDSIQTTANGLQYKVLTMGTGAKPTKEQTVQVIYEGKTIDGTVFDATSKHNTKKGYDAFRCDQVIKGWGEALTMMPVGSKWVLYIPQDLAYGQRQAGQIKPYSALIFTVELKGIEPDKKPAATLKPATKTQTGNKTVAKKKTTAKSTKTTKK